MKEQFFASFFFPAKMIGSRRMKNSRWYAMDIFVLILVLCYSEA